MAEAVSRRGKGENLNPRDPTIPALVRRLGQEEKESKKITPGSFIVIGVKTGFGVKIAVALETAFKQKDFRFIANEANVESGVKYVVPEVTLQSDENGRTALTVGIKGYSGNADLSRLENLLKEVSSVVMRLDILKKNNLLVDSMIGDLEDRTIKSIGSGDFASLLLDVERPLLLALHYER